MKLTQFNIALLKSEERENYFRDFIKESNLGDIVTINDPSRIFDLSSVASNSLVHLDNVFSRVYPKSGIHKIVVDCVNKHNLKLLITSYYFEPIEPFIFIPDSKNEVSILRMKDDNKVHLIEPRITLGLYNRGILPNATF